MDGNKYGQWCARIFGEERLYGQGGGREVVFDYGRAATADRRVVMGATGW